MTTPGDRHSVAGAMFFLAFVSVLIPMMATDAVGLNMDLVPSVRLEQGWQSNVYNTSTDEVSSFGTRLTPALALRFTSADNVMLQVSGNYEKVWYYSSEAKAADYNTWFFRIDSTGGWSLTPTWTVVPSVYYLNTTNSSQRSQQVPSGDPVLPPVTITNYGNTDTEDLGAAVNLNYLATPNLTIGVNGNYSEQRFSGGTDNTAGSGLTNSKQTGGNVSVSYLFSPRTSLGILVAGNHQTYENAPDSNTLSGGILFGYQFSPPLRIEGVFGMSYIRQSEAPGIPEQRTSSPSGIFNITYSRETFTASMFGSYVYSGGSGYGEATRQKTTGLVFTDQFTREWSGNLSGTYQVSQSVFTSETVDIVTWYGTAGLSYRPWEWGSLDLTGNLNRQTSNGQFGEPLNNYSATLGITISKPYKIY
jgi:Putative outer membrane beta-barrel porin, MtrB/PioB